MGFDEVIKGKKGEEEELSMISERYHELEREEIEKGYLKTAMEDALKKVAERFKDAFEDKDIDYVSESAKTAEAFKGTLYRTRKSFFGGDEESREMMEFIEMFGTDRLEQAVRITEFAHRGDAVGEGAAERMPYISVFNTLCKDFKVFEKHYVSVAREVKRAASEKGIEALKAVEMEEVRDEALRSVLKTKEEYEKFSEADRVVIMKMRDFSAKRAGVEDPEEKEFFDIIYEGVEKALEEYHNGRAEKLYRKP